MEEEDDDAMGLEWKGEEKLRGQQKKGIQEMYIYRQLQHVLLHIICQTWKVKPTTMVVGISKALLIELHDLKHTLYTILQVGKDNPISIIVELIGGF